MELKSEQELANTRQKLTMLEASYQDMQKDTTESAYVREATLRSLKRLINQLKEEIARYEAHQTVRR